MKKRIGVLLSGRGSNFEALADSVAAGRIPNAEIALVVSNREGAPGIEKARARGIETRVIPSKGLEREAYDKLVVAALQEKKCRSRLPRRLHAAAFAVFRGGVSESHSEYSSVAAAGISGARIAAAGARARREIFGMHGAFRGRKSRCRADRAAGGGADPGWRHARKRFPSASCAKSTAFIPKPCASCSKGATASKAAAC